MENNNPIFVTKPALPPLEQYIEYLKGIWEREYLTNNGPLVQELEEKIKEFLGVRHCFLVTNGTMALQLSIKALELKGEIITTPFSFVATTSSIVWEHCTPVFVDIDENTLNINPNLIEDAITENTTAILATHVYGNPCDVEKIQQIADKYNLKVIYDGAHAFGTKYKGKSLLSYGDVSTVSFHATKLFSTVEGGAIITNDDQLAEKIDIMRNFGLVGQEIETLGTNAKLSEVHAAFGLCMLPKVPEIIEQREQICNWYDEQLQRLNLKRPVLMDDTIYNYAYYPVIFESEEQLLKVQEKLNEHNIFPKRYFYPALNHLPYISYNFSLFNAGNLTRRVLCLPLFNGLKRDQILLIAKIIFSVF